MYPNNNDDNIINVKQESQSIESSEDSKSDEEGSEYEGNNKSSAVED